MRTPPIRILPCSHLQGAHCVKIGCKCVEKRWFQNVSCSISDKKIVPFTPPRPEPLTVDIRITDEELADFKEKWRKEIMGEKPVADFNHPYEG